MSEPLTYTVRETAAALRCSERTIHRLVKSGTLPVVRIGRAVRIRAASLREFLERGSVRKNETQTNSKEREQAAVVRP